MEDVELFKRLGVALAAGMLIGLERGWHERAAPEGGRVAGIRTFAIVGLLGGLWALLGELVGEIALGFAFLAFAVVMIVARIRAAAKILPAAFPAAPASYSALPFTMAANWPMLKA